MYREEWKKKYEIVISTHKVELYQIYVWRDTGISRVFVDAESDGKVTKRLTYKQSHDMKGNGSD